jgi:hypothetical protein
MKIIFKCLKNDCEINVLKCGNCEYFNPLMAVYNEDCYYLSERLQIGL